MLTDGSAVEMSEAEKMIALADSDVSAGIDFVEFFRLFMFTPCITVHQALTEWRNKVALVQRKRTSSETANLGQQGIAGKGGGGESVKRRVYWILNARSILPCVTSLLPNYSPLLTIRTTLLLQLASLDADMSKYDGSWVVGGEVIMNVVENVRYR